MTIGAVTAAAAVAGAEEPNFHIAAQVDKTTIEVGASIKLSITLEGDVRKATIQPFEFPPQVAVAAQSRATNVAIHAGQMTRAVTLQFVLLAREAGTFQLGPFQVLYDGKPVLTEPLEITVTKPVLPPGSEVQQRYTL